MLLVPLLSLAALATAECTRSMLQDATAGYLAALAAGKTSIPALAEGSVPYQENDVVMDISKGVLSAPVKIDFNRSIFDTTQCASYTEIEAASNKPAYVIGTRLAFTGDKITKIEVNVCTDKDWLFNAQGSLTNSKKENWDIIPEGKRDSRDVIKAAGDAYINAWGDKTIKPPFSSDCARLEGGSYISGGNCNLNFPPPFNVTNRRYTIDEQLGAVDIFHNFPFIDKAIPRDPGTQTNNLMRVEGGKIRYIHENTVCSKKGCNK